MQGLKISHSTCTSSLYTSTYDQTEVYGVSEIIATLGLSLFVIGLGVGSMVIPCKTVGV